MRCLRAGCYVVTATRLGWEQRRDTRHDLSGQLLAILAPQHTAHLWEEEWFPERDRHTWKAEPWEATPEDLGCAGECYWNDRRSGVEGQQCSPTVRLAEFRCPVARSFGEDPEQPSFGEHPLRHSQRMAIDFAAPHRDGPVK